MARDASPTGADGLSRRGLLTAAAAVGGAAVGGTVRVQPADGNTYGDKLPPLLAANKLPDWICIPGWNTTNLDFGTAVGLKFVDLTPYLAGDKVKDYPNLAAIPTGAWQAGV